MREYATQMEAARKGIITKELEEVAKKRANDSRRINALSRMWKSCYLRKQKAQMH